MLCRSVTLSLLAALTFAAPALAQPYEASYKDFYDELKRFEARPNTDRLQLRTSLRPEDRDGSVGRIDMTILTADGAVPVQVDDDNAFVLPMNPAWVDEKARIQLTADPKDLDIRVQVGMQLPSATEFHYSDVTAAFDQFNAVIEREAGMFAFAVPSAKTLRIQCGQSCTATLDGPNGSRILAADEKGRVNIPADKKLRRENPRILLSHPARYTAISTKQ